MRVNDVVKRVKYRCRDPQCAAVHHSYFADGRCARCKRPGMLREIKPGSTLELITAAVADDDQPKQQRELFPESMA
ncbi:hypothetical protein CA54_40880 [Symmachiella macrocystis]|uniref:Transposase zinc-binding domain-containing protein n=1 Tax=Symmachiella macrocystis TaxID=2527985 RepID=A0A5C6BBL6_9PLAN|nr:hypothetical protein CA54_40880 [Symmachiella macrocystis]